MLESFLRPLSLIVGGIIVASVALLLHRYVERARAPDSKPPRIAGRGDIPQSEPWADSAMRFRSQGMSREEAIWRAQTDWILGGGFARRHDEVVRNGLKGQQGVLGPRSLLSGDDDDDDVSSAVQRCQLRGLNPSGREVSITEGLARAAERAEAFRAAVEALKQIDPESLPPYRTQTPEEQYRERLGALSARWRPPLAGGASRSPRVLLPFEVRAPVIFGNGDARMFRGLALLYRAIVPIADDARAVLEETGESAAYEQIWNQAVTALLSSASFPDSELHAAGSALGFLKSERSEGTGRTVDAILSRLGDRAAEIARSETTQPAVASDVEE